MTLTEKLKWSMATSYVLLVANIWCAYNCYRTQHPYVGTLNGLMVVVMAVSLRQSHRRLHDRQSVE